MLSPQCWADLVSPRSKLGMLVFFRNKDKIYLQSASITNSRKIRFTDFAVELFGKAPEESPMDIWGGFREREMVGWKTCFRRVFDLS